MPPEFRSFEAILVFFVLGFDRYKGGLDTVHDLTGLYSMFTRWRGIEVMFHVSTHLHNEPNDHQKVDFMYEL